MPSPTRHWNGRQSNYSTNFRRRKCSGIYSRRSRNVLADVGGIWNFSVCQHPACAIIGSSSLIITLIKGGVREPYRMEYWTLGVATAIRVCGHTRDPSSSRHLLLSWYVSPCQDLYLLIQLSESPRWYMKKNQYLKAFASLRRLRNSDLQAARDLFFIHSTIDQELKKQEGRGYFTRLLELFTLKRNRPATLAAFTVMIAQQMCGSTFPFLQCAIAA